MRMCAYWWHEPFVDDVLDALTPEQFAEWMALAEIDHLDSPWQMMGIICETFQNWTYVANAAEYDEKRLMNAKDFIPRRRKKEPEESNIAHAEKVFSGMFKKK